MKYFLSLFLSLNVAVCVSAQFVHKIKADSVLITNDSCNAELNLENSTKHINGFLYNKGNGRTEFKKGLVKINDSLYIIGGDTLNTRSNISFGSSGQIPYTNGSANNFSYSSGLTCNGNTLTIGSSSSPSIVPSHTIRFSTPHDVQSRVESPNGTAYLSLSENSAQAKLYYSNNYFLAKPNSVSFYSAGTEKGNFKNTEFVVNDFGLNYNTRMESDNNENLFFLDGANDVIGLGSNTPHASALLSVNSTTKGFLPSRMTASQRTSISSPADGLVVYDTDSNRVMINRNDAWRGLKYTDDSPATTIQNLFTTSQFDMESDDDLTGITGLSATVASSGIYRFEIRLHVSPDNTGGQKFDLGGGSATATSVIYEAVIYNNDDARSVDVANRITSLTASFAPAGSGITSSHITMIVIITVNSGGTLVPRFAQQTESGTSSILAGSTFTVTKIN